eukprot:5652849-Karenia_brevis.AAC.1
MRTMTTTTTMMTTTMRMVMILKDVDDDGAGHLGSKFGGLAPRLEVLAHLASKLDSLGAILAPILGLGCKLGVLVVIWVPSCGGLGSKLGDPGAILAQGAKGCIKKKKKNKTVSGDCDRFEVELRKGHLHTPCFCFQQTRCVMLRTWPQREAWQEGSLHILFFLALPLSTVEEMDLKPPRQRWKKGAKKSSVALTGQCRLERQILVKKQTLHANFAIFAKTSKALRGLLNI